MIEPIHQWMTLAFIILMITIVVAYDVAVNHLCGPHATISRALLRFSLDHQIVVPIVCFTAGVIVGHIFLPQYVR